MSFGFPEFYSVFSGIIRNYKPQYVLAAWLVDFDGMNTKIPMDPPALNRLVHNGSRAKDKFNDIKDRLEKIKPTQLVEYFRDGINGDYAIKSHPIVIRAYKSKLEAELADIPETKDMLLKYASKDTMPEFLACLFYYSFTEGELLIPDVLVKNIPNRLPEEFWISRKSQEDRLEELLKDGAKEIYVIGAGGQGKTEFITSFVSRRQNMFNFYFTTFKGSIQDTVLQLDFSDWNAETIDSSTNRLITKSVAQQYKEKLHMLKKFDETTVLIIDNFDGDAETLLNDPCLKELKCLQLRLILTTRMPMVKKSHVLISSFPTDDLLWLMHQYIGNLYSDDELRQIIEIVGHNTLLVDLIARLLSDSLLGTTPTNVITALQDGKWNSIPEKVSGEYNRDESEKTILKHLLTLFDVSGLSEDASYVLSCTSLLPTEGIYSPLFLRCLGNDKKWLDVVNKLRRAGWINFNRQSTKIAVHPLVREACIQNESTKPGWVRNRSYILTVTNEVEDPLSYQMAMQLMTAMREIQLTICPEMDYWDIQAALFFKTGFLYNYLGDSQTALHFMEIATSFRNDLPLSHPEIIRMKRSIADAKQRLGLYDEAVELFREILKIRQEQLGTSDHPDLVAEYSNLCGTLANTEDYEEGISYGLKALRLEEQSVNPDPRYLRFVHTALSWAYGKAEKYQEELLHAQKAIEILESHPIVTAEDVIEPYCKICQALSHHSRYEEALTYALKLLQLCQKEFPTNHLMLTPVYENVIFVYKKLGDKDKICEYSERKELLEKELDLWS